MKQGYEEWRNRQLENSDDYVVNILKAAEAGDRALMEGKSPADAEDAMVDAVDDMTGNMMGWAAWVISKWSEKGEEFRRYWNERWGQADAEGVIDPATIVVEKKEV